MAILIEKKNGFSVKAYPGDGKTLLAFNLSQAKAKNLAGFTIGYTLAAGATFYVQNNLRYKDPSRHVQDLSQSPNSTLNAPIHKFRWVHVPGSINQGTQPAWGPYVYSVTPRYFDGAGSLTAIDPTKSVTIKVDVGPYAKGAIEVGNTRGFTQSQAFVHHFGLKALLPSKKKTLLFDTSAVSGTNSKGESYTYEDQYRWLGFTARKKIFDLLQEVLDNPKLKLDMLGYDLSEPDVLKLLIEIAKQGRVRLILDNAALHHDATGKKSEDQFEKLFTAAAVAPAQIMRGKFGRYAHHKVFIISDQKGPLKILSGSTNISITGLYVNSNHVVVFNEREIAKIYAEVFDKCWKAEMWGGGSSTKFNGEPEANIAFQYPSAAKPMVEINFSPHKPAHAAQILDGLATRIKDEAKQKTGSVLFAVMEMKSSTGPVLPALQEIHKATNVFSYGISDSPAGIELYAPRKKTGVLVSGKPKSYLPPPFDQVPNINLGHQVHHKFVVCGFNGPNPVVYFGSSNLAQGGEESNGDNLIAVHDADIATVFAIEALTLVDHFQFLNRSAETAETSAAKVKAASNQQQAAAAGWFLSTSDRWTLPYFDSSDLHCVDRQLFGA